MKNSFTKSVIRILSKFLPAANPDFDQKIDDVKFWLVEWDSETGIPEREVGLDGDSRVIMKMPFKNNYGYWTDNNLRLSDFRELFKVSEISMESFEEQWRLFNR
ncbi:MAG TPA: hypothetical protein VGQ53_15030 [Chitinophagaceae bacterium]|nr:hypothetical protein [Chitinophagaceae bacterium]